MRLIDGVIFAVGIPLSTKTKPTSKLGVENRVRVCENDKSNFKAGRCWCSPRAVWWKRKLLSSCEDYIKTFMAAVEIPIHQQMNFL